MIEVELPKNAILLVTAHEGQYKCSITRQSNEQLPTKQSFLRKHIKLEWAVFQVMLFLQE